MRLDWIKQKRESEEANTGPSTVVATATSAQDDSGEGGPRKTAGLSTIRRGGPQRPPLRMAVLWVYELLEPDQ